MFDEKIDILIEEIKKRPAIYNKSTPEFTNDYLKKLLWREICQNVIKNWNELSKEEQNEAEKEIQKRWISLRNCFTRELRLRRESKMNKTERHRRRPYVHFKSLMFLLPVVGSKEGINVNVLDGDYSYEKDTTATELEPAYFQEDVDTMDTNSAENFERYDEDLNFVMSLVPMLKTLGLQENADLQNQILTLFKNAQPSSSADDSSSKPQFHFKSKSATPPDVLIAKKKKKRFVPSNPPEETVRRAETPKRVEAITPNLDIPSTVSNVPTHHLRHEDEYTAIGITVEAKLRKMQYDQRLYAENLINQTLYKGLLFQLSEHSKIVTNKRQNDSDRHLANARERPAFVSVAVKKRRDAENNSSEEEDVMDGIIMPDEIDDALLNIKTRMSDSSDND